MALHVMTADPGEFKTFYSSLSRDEHLCLETASSILKRRLLASPMAASVTHVSTQWAFCLDCCESIDVDSYFQTIIEAKGGVGILWGGGGGGGLSDAPSPGPQKHAGGLEAVPHQEPQAHVVGADSRPCGAVASAPGASSKSCSTIVGGPGELQGPTEPRGPGDEPLQRQQGSQPFHGILPASLSTPKELIAPAAAPAPGTEEKPNGRARQTGAHARKQHIQRQGSGTESFLSSTISEQGRANLAKYAEVENTIGACTGTGAEASRRQWVADEGAKSQALFQRYTSKASPQERRLSKEEQQASKAEQQAAAFVPRPKDAWLRYPELSLSTSTLGAEDSHKASPDNDDILLSESSSRTLNNLVIAAEGMLEEAQAGDPQDTALPGDFVQSTQGLLDEAVAAMSYCGSSPVSPINAVLEVNVPDVPDLSGDDALEEALELTRSEAEELTDSDAAAPLDERWEQWKQRKAARKERKAQTHAAKESSKKVVVAANKRISCPSIIMHAGSRSSNDLAAIEGGAHDLWHDIESLSGCSCASRLSVHTLESGVFQLSQNFSQCPEESGWRLDNADAGEASYRSWR